MLNTPPLHDPQFHAGDPFPAFRRLRTEAPVYWHPTPGFWTLTRHEDVFAVSRDPATFCSSRGILLSDIERPVIPRQSIIYIDPPEHAQYRKLVQPAFSPGRLRALENRTSMGPRTGCRHSNRTTMGMHTRRDQRSWQLAVPSLPADAAARRTRG